MKHTSISMYAVLAVLIIGDVYQENFKSYAQIIVSSSSSDYGSSCNGLTCPANTNCLAYSNSNNGIYINDKRCTTYDGRVVRQETRKIGNGKMCLKNVTLIHNKVNVSQTCKNLKPVIQAKGKAARRDQDSIDATQNAEQDMIDAAINKQDSLLKDWKDRIDRDKDHKIKLIENAKNYWHKVLEMKKKQYEEKYDAWQDYLEEMKERLEDQAKEREAQMELQQKQKQLQMEREKELLEMKFNLLAQKREQAILKQQNRLDNIEKSLDLKNFM